MTNDKCFAYYDLLKSNLFFATQKNVELYFDDWIWHKIHRKKKKKTCFRKKKEKIIFTVILKNQICDQNCFSQFLKNWKKNKIKYHTDN